MRAFTHLEENSGTQKPQPGVGRIAMQRRRVMTVQAVQLALRVPPKNSDQRILDRSASRPGDVFRPSVDSQPLEPV
jgi:hypothetical protein